LAPLESWADIDDREAVFAESPPPPMMADRRIRSRVTRARWDIASTVLRQDVRERYCRCIDAGRRQQRNYFRP